MCEYFLHQILLVCSDSDMLWRLINCRIIIIIIIYQSDVSYAKMTETSNFSTEQSLIFIKMTNSGIVVMLVWHRVIFMLFLLMHNILRKLTIRCLWICPPHMYTVAALPWKVQKVIFDNVIHMCFQMFRLLLNKMGYNCQMQLTGRPLLKLVFKLTSLCVNTTTESVTPLFDRLIHGALLNLVHVSTATAPCLPTRPNPGDIHAAASRPRCDNL